MPARRSPNEIVDCERRLSLDCTPAAMVYFWQAADAAIWFSLTFAAVTRRSAPLLFVFSFCQVGLDALLSGKHRLRLRHFSSLQW